MKNKIDDLLDFDAIDTAEKILNQRSGEMVGLLGLSLQMNNNERLAKALEEIGDVNSWNQSLDTYISILKHAGFQQLLVDDIPNTNDKFYIFWRDGVLVSFDTYSNHTTVNGGHVYLNFEFNCDNSHDAWDALSGCSSGHIDYDESNPTRGRTVGIDCRQALLHRLNKMNKVGTILKQWKKRPFLWLLHYQDTKDDDYDFKAINAERIGRLPIEVQEAITPK